MDEFARRPADDRRAFIQEAANRRNLTDAVIEKDFWVCWTLRRLVRCKELNGHFTFKVSDIGWEMLRDAPGCRPAPYLASRGMKWIQNHEPGLGKRELKQYLKASHALVAAGLSKRKRAELGL